MAGAVVTSVAEGIRVLRREEVLFVSLGVGDFILLHSGLTSHDGLLAGVNFVVSDGIASAKEIETHCIGRLTVVQSDLDTACTKASSLERVFFNFNLNTVLNLSNLL